jgi:hypothetical protein
MASPVSSALALCVVVAASACQGGTPALTGGGGRAHKAGDAAPAEKRETPPAEETTALERTEDEGAIVEEEQRVTPPEVVSGAYLTEGAVTSVAVPAPAGRAYYGAKVFDGRDQRVDLEQHEVELELRFKSGGLVPNAERVSLPDVDEDVVWSVAAEDRNRGLKVKMILKGEDGVEQVVKSCWNNTRNGVVIGVTCE